MQRLDYATEKKGLTVMRFFLACFILSLSFVPLSQAHAQSVGITVRPIKISHTMLPGSTVSGSIALTNASPDVVDIDLGIEDFIPSAGTTNVQFIGRAEGVTTVRDWISLDSTDGFTFDSKGDERNITYTITAPEDAEPGGHFGVIFFKANKNQDGGQLKVGTRIGVLVFITIPGDSLQKGQILDFKGPKFVQKTPVTFNIKFENTGTVHYEPKGTVTIKNLFGRKIAEVPVQGQTVLPTGIRDLTVSWDTSGLLFGRYTAELDIKDGEGNSLSAEKIAFYAFPIWYTFGFIVAMLLILWVIRFLKKRVKFSISLKND